jgi:Xaa-Pro aminopeptidase
MTTSRWGHGVGLEVHEHPSLGQTGHGELMAGDVIAIEPGLGSATSVGSASRICCW